MALIQCYECGAPISDKAVACLKCGAPVIMRDSDYKDEDIKESISTESDNSTVIDTKKGIGSGK